LSREIDTEVRKSISFGVDPSTAPWAN
ncbi:MAG: hypothetical protein ACJA1Z_003820, partial [Patiriisocius sp.]